MATLDVKCSECGEYYYYSQVRDAVCCIGCNRWCSTILEGKPSDDYETICEHNYHECNEAFEIGDED